MPSKVRDVTALPLRSTRVTGPVDILRVKCYRSSWRCDLGGRRDRLKVVTQHCLYDQHMLHKGGGGFVVTYTSN